MSELDDFARATVGPTLRPGEALLAVGWMAPHTSRWRDTQERYLAVGTNQRLVVIETGKSLMHGVPNTKPVGTTAYELAPLTRVVSNDVAALTTNLALHQAGGNVAWAIPSPSIIGAKSVEGHPDFVATYMPWLGRHVAAGTLRTPEGQAAAAHEWHDRATLAQANDRYLITTGSTNTKATRFVKWPLLLAIVCLGLVPIGLAYKQEIVKKIGYVERHIEFVRETVADGHEIQFDPAASEASDRAEIEQLKSKQVLGTLMTAGGGVGFVGLLILSFVLTSKKRSRARAAATASRSAPSGSS